MEVTPDRYDLAGLTSEEFAGLVGGSRPVAVMVPVGCVEPHGPHLPLETDTIISRAAAVRAAERLDGEGLAPLIAPDVAYGVTNCARAFKGAVSIPAAALTAFLRGVIDGLLANGAAHVCLINNHLEPEHAAAVRAAADGVGAGRASVACPLEKRWARTLSAEFKSGACHAGEYETSIVLSAAPPRVRKERLSGLPEVPVSLSDKLGAGVSDFVEMGLSRAYAGAPAKATPQHGEEMLERLATMVATVVLEAMGRARP